MFMRKGLWECWLYVPLFVLLELLGRGVAPLWGFYLGLATLFLLLLRTLFLTEQESKLHAVLGFILLGQLCLFALRSAPLLGNRFVLSALVLTLTAWAALRVAGSWPRVPAPKAFAIPQDLLAGAPYTLLGALLGVLAFAVQPAQPVSALSPTLVFAILLLLAAVGEELLFRGTLLPAAVGLLGAKQGVFWSAGVYASFALPLSWPAVGFVFLLGLAFGWLALSALSVVGVSLAHVAVNLTLLIVLPFWWPRWGAG